MQPQITLTPEDRERLTRNIALLMMHVNPLEFACLEVANHAGDLAVALDNMAVLFFLNEARMHLLYSIEQRLTDDD